MCWLENDWWRGKYLVSVILNEGLCYIYIINNINKCLRRINKFYKTTQIQKKAISLRNNIVKVKWKNKKSKVQEMEKKLSASELVADSM